MANLEKVHSNIRHIYFNNNNESNIYLLQGLKTWNENLLQEQKIGEECNILGADFEN